MRSIISKKCGLEFLTEKRNNESISDMSFGVSVFQKCNEACPEAEAYFVENILSEGFGSVAVGVKLTNGDIYWGIHFPLDFKGQGKDNLGYKTMVNLQAMLDDYPGSVCALGDFNTIPGNIEDAILSAVQPNNRLVHNGDTFFGAYYDTIPAEEAWDSLT